MKLCVLSGKGGTGKTFVSTNLFQVAKDATYFDCDIEEPNGALFFNDLHIESKPVYKKVPVIDQEACIGCSKCVDFCRFHSLSLIGDQVYFFDEMCHSCGGCALVCKEHAIHETQKEVGVIEHASTQGKDIYTGRMHIKEVSGSRIIDELLGLCKEDRLNIIDCPPGSDCSVMESIRDCDYGIVVVEPTLFGEHNMKMVIELLQVFEKPYGIVFNKAFEESYPTIEEYVKENNGEILGSIPFSKEIAAFNNRGKLISENNKEYKVFFEDLLEKVVSR